MRTLWVVLLLLPAMLLTRLHAQRLAEPSFPSIEDSAPSPSPPAPIERRMPPHPAWLAAGGLLGAVAVGVGGAWTGVQITEDDCEDCFLVGGAYGLVAGVSVGGPLGVHLANDRRGNLLTSLGASLALGGLGLGIAHLTHEEGVMFAVPVLQIAGAILVERRAGR